MAIGVQQIGITGPAGRIGAGTEYHIDTKYLRSKPWEWHAARFDAKAKEYAKEGRNIIFSNEGVHGTPWKVDATLAEKIDLLKRVDAAHSHSVHKDWASYDYFAPKGFDVNHPSAQGAPILVAGKAGRKVEGHTGPKYGNFGVVVDENNNLVGKTGHGDINQAVFKGGVLGGGDVIEVDVEVDAPGILTVSDDAPEEIETYKAIARNARDVVNDMGNNFQDMKSARLGAALAGAQEDIIQRRMDAGQNFGKKLVRMAGDKKIEED